MSKKSMKQYKQKFEVPKKEVKKKKNEVLAWVLAGFMVLWTIMGVLGTIGFFKSRNIESASAEVVDVVDEQSTTKRIKHSQKTVFRDTQYGIALKGFIGASLPADVPDTYYLITGNLNLVFEGDTVSLSYNTLYSSDAQFISLMNGSRALTVRCIALNFANDLTATFNVSYINNAGVEFNVNNGIFPYKFVYSTYYDGQSFSYYIDIQWYNSLMQPVGTSRVDFNFDPGQFSDMLYNSYFGVTFDYDANSVIGETLWEDTQRYLELYRLQGSYDTVYEQGFNAGYADGEVDGYAQGRTDGYNVGYVDGHADGLEDANVYTFKGLLGAVFDVPVQTFQGLFNFEILGVNLSGFLMAILTIMIILAVIKLII